MVDDQLSDIVAGRFDAGIRVSGRLEKDIIAARPTPEVKMVALASPGYLAQGGVPRTPGELHQHACINWRLQADGSAHRWVFKKKKNKKRLEVAVQGPLVTHHSDIGIAAALQGMGIAYAFDREPVDEHLARGEQVQVLADWSMARPGLAATPRLKCVTELCARKLIHTDFGMGDQHEPRRQAGPAFGSIPAYAPVHVLV